MLPKLLSKRPPDMPYEDYVQIRKYQKELLKAYKKGKIVQLQKVELEKPIWVDKRLN